MQTYRNLRFSVLVGLVSTLSACGSLENQASNLSAVSSSNLEGTWAKRMISVSDSSALGVSSQSKVIRIHLVQLKANGDKLVAEETNCVLRAENKGSSSINFPSAFFKGLSPRSYSYDIQGGDAVSGLSLSNAVEIFGARLQNPLSDVLPSAAQDSRVFDQDGDGNPGMTVDVSVKVLVTVKGSIYVSQRQIWSEDLKVLSADKIQGRYLWSSEQNILGSSNSLFTSVKPTVTPQLDQSSIEMVRLPGGANCDTAAASF